MRALVKKEKTYGALELRQLPVPVLNHDEVLIKVKACGVCGSDLHVYEGTPGYEFLEYPVILGHEFCGTVVDKGGYVNGFNVGDRVVSEAGIGCGSCSWCRQGFFPMCETVKAYGLHLPGGMAQYVKVNPAVLHRLDDRISFQAGAVIEPAAVSLRAVLGQSHIQPGDFVVIFGAGVIGQITAQICLLMGAGPVVIVGSVEDKSVRLAKAAETGVETLVFSEHLMDEIREVFYGQKPKIVFECSGSVLALDTALDTSQKGGAVVVVGIYAKPLEIDMTTLVRNRISLVPSYAYGWQEFQKTVDLAAEGKIDLESILSCYPLEDATKAFEDSLNKKVVKAVLEL